MAKKRFGLRQSALVYSCYEAGRDGFWIHRALVEMGVDNVVVDPSSIEVPRRKRRAKTDRLDVHKLLKLLIRYRLGEAKVWSVVNVPSVEEEDNRHLHRELLALKRERTALDPSHRPGRNTGATKKHALDNRGPHRSRTFQRPSKAGSLARNPTHPPGPTGRETPAQG